MPVVPKRIHQTWKTEDVPAKWAASPDAWRAYHPSWEYKLWTDADNRALIETHYAWFLPQFDAYPYPIQRADAARYFILHRYGGVYCDLDMAPTGPIDAWVAAGQNIPHIEAYFIRSTITPWCLTNAFMASAPNADIWTAVFRDLTTHKPPMWACTKHGFVMTTTGPLMLNRVVTSFAPQGIAILPLQKFCPKQGGALAIRANHVITPIDEGQSWCSTDSYVLTWCNSNWKGLAILAGALVVLVLVVCVVLFLRVRSRQRALTACELRAH